MTPRAQMIRLEGFGVSSGIAIGRAVSISSRGGEIFRIPLREEDIEAEKARFRQACTATRAEIERTRATGGELFDRELAAIFDAHTLLLADPSFRGEIEGKIERDRVNAEWAVHEATEALLGRFALLENAYLRERGEDLEDVSRQLQRALSGAARHEISEVEGEIVVVADELVPSEAIRLGRGRVVGFAIESGGRTSHTSIIARSLEIPAVTGVAGVSELVTDEDFVIVDGDAGVVVLHPTAEVLEEYRERLRGITARSAIAVDAHRDAPCRTVDGVEIELLANIDLPEELAKATRVGARGIGLYRSEFLYMETDPRLPTEDDHLDMYRRLLAAAAPYPVVVRTYDLGGRKLAREMMESTEDNPVLGLRGIRLTLARPKIFRTQLRALMRAAAEGDLRVMAPMVSGVAEVRALRRALAETAEELARDGLPHRASFKVGIMIEVPAAAVAADLLAREADFFAIGTNDLVQYSLAVDRDNQQVADLYQPLHPAILRMLRFVAASANAAGIEASLCGEMAADPEHLGLLVGLGLRRFSVHPRAIPILRERVAGLHAGALVALADRCCMAACEREVAAELAMVASAGERQAQF